MQLYDSFKERNQKVIQNLIDANVGETRKASYAHSKNLTRHRLHIVLTRVHVEPYQRVGFPEPT